MRDSGPRDGYPIQVFPLGTTPVREPESRSTCGVPRPEDFAGHGAVTVARNEAGHGPRGAAPDAVAARPAVAAALAEHLGEINERWSKVAQLLAEIALSPADPIAPVADGPERMWKPQQVADAWGVSYRTVLGWIKSKDLVAVEVGDQYRVPDSECVRFIRDQIRVGIALKSAA